MNSFSFSLIFIGGVLLSFVFKSIALKLGFSKKFFDQPYSFLILPFVYMAGFLLYPVVFLGQLALQTQGFYPSIYFWFAVALFLGGLVRFIFDKIKKN